MTDGARLPDDPEMQPVSELLRMAAAALLGEAAPDGATGDLLARLDYLDGAAELAPHRARLLRAASGFRRIFTLDEAGAPGLVAVGAELDPAGIGVPDAPLASVSGAGLSFRDAFEACVGEGVEHLSRYASEAHPIEQLSAQDALDGAPPPLLDLWERLQSCRRDPAAPRVAWTIAADLANGHPVRLPTDICLRRPPPQRDLDPPWPLSSGCAAAPDHLRATLSALFELAERDAVALWWRGGRRARLAPPGAGAAFLERLRAGATSRQTWFLDITDDAGIPAVVAASCNEDGFGLCCGSAARATLAGAADAAAREMAQMELAHTISATKRAVRGEAALNALDHQHLRRYATVQVRETTALHPLAPPSPPPDLPVDDPRATLAALRERLSAIGAFPAAIDLTHPAFRIPVVRVVCPGLQEAGVGSPAGPRLLHAARLSGADPNAVMPL
jgi:ribosomal protein S12 methylthiotransferase accessory factor